MNSTSNIEVNDLAEVLSANMAMAFLYVVGRDEVDEALKNLDRAEWHVGREIKRLRLAPPSHVANPEFGGAYLPLVAKFVEAEFNADARLFYIMVLQRCEVRTYLQALDSCLDSIVSLRLRVSGEVMPDRVGENQHLVLPHRVE